MMIKCVIFDLDNTLVESFELHLRSYQRAFAEAGVVIAREDIVKRYGVRMREAVRQIAAERMPGASREQIEGIIAKKKRYFLEALSDVKPYAATRRVLSELRSAGYKTALASSSPRDVIEATLEQLSLKAAFDAVVAGNEVSETKPAPQVLLRAAEVLGVAAGECVYVGDTVFDAQAASAAGMPFVGVTTGVHSGKEMQDACARCGIIGDLSELRGVLEKWR
jgi:HAD superfamily hydrolase (TIGR01509 family)